MRIGVLALQGGFDAHLRALAAIGHEAMAVRRASELSCVEGLVLPGGESTTILQQIERDGLREALEGFRERPVLATCAGLILVARAVTQPAQPSLGWLDVDVCRNAYGRQIDSFEARSDEAGDPLVFIRAPKITRVGEGVEVLRRHAGEPVMVRQGGLIAATFHPELTADRSVHALAFDSQGRGAATPAPSTAARGRAML